MFKILKVTGSSLSPFFLPDDYILARKAPRHYPKLTKGDTVVFRHIQYGVMIKRVISNDPVNKILRVEGTHPDSVSTEKIGDVSYQDLLGKVIRRIRT